MIFSSEHKLNSLLKKKHIVFLLAFLCLISFSTCNNSENYKGPQYNDSKNEEIPVYHFLVHPLHNPVKLTQCCET
jgi:hypothetical protein